MKGRYSPIPGEKHIHRKSNGVRFSFTPMEELAHATSYSVNKSQWSSASILALQGGKVIYTYEEIWSDEDGSHECEVYASLEKLLECLQDLLHGEDLLDELIEKWLVNEAQFVEEVDSEPDTFKKRVRQVRDAFNKCKDSNVVEPLCYAYRRQT